MRRYDSSAERSPYEERVVSINRVAITPESAAEFERLGARWLRGERGRLPPEELLSRQLVRADDRPEYAVLSAWAM